jgi:hypothetical protein
MVIVRLECLAAVFFLTSCSAIGQARDVFSIEGCGLVDRAAVLDTRSLLSNDLEVRAKEFVAANLGRSRLFRLTFGTSAADVGSALGQNPAFLGTEERLKEIRASWPPNRPIATVIGLGGAAVLILNDGRGGISRKLLAGREDPTRLVTGSDDLTVLHFHIAMSREKPPQCSTIVYVHLKAPISVSKCARAARTLEAIIGAGSVSTVCQATYWNIGDTNFPAIYRFGSLTPVPTKFEALNQSSLSCSTDRGLRCSGSGFVP